MRVSVCVPLRAVNCGGGGGAGLARAGPDVAIICRQTACRPVQNSRDVTMTCANTDRWGLGPCSRGGFPACKFYFAQE